MKTVTLYVSAAIMILLILGATATDIAIVLNAFFR
jgi:hypothetical protein